MAGELMKSLIIIGVPRAGKSTLGACCARQIGRAGHAVSLMGGDCLMGGIQAIYQASPLYRALYRPMKHMVPALARAYNERLWRDLAAFTTRAVSEQAAQSVVIYEGVYLSPRAAVKMFDPAHFRIVAIGYPNADIDEKMRDIRAFDTNTPASRRSDAQLRQYIARYVESSRRLACECEKYGITFIDTSTDYTGQINRFADNVMELLKE